MLKELYQAEHQRGRDVSPRMHRDLHYAIERAVTNVGLRTISTALVIEEMYRGAPVIFVDYTGYDAVAHHSGPERRESIDALEGIDRAIGSLLKADVHATRRYHVVLLSDHGQSMGPIFRQVYGQPVEALLGKLMPGEAVVVGEQRDGRERRQRGPDRGRAGPRHRLRAVPCAAGAGDPATRPRDPTPRRRGDRKPDAVVCSSGSLAHVYFAKVGRASDRGRPSSGAYPGLIAGAGRTIPGSGRSWSGPMRATRSPSARTGSAT